ncbi:MAG: glycosyltransferase [ANME-2 cluster archaeon]|nr:MAG: glycosyltransferase [ANME-2 cluster archaeon]
MKRFKMGNIKQTDGRNKICFVALSAYPLLMQKNIKRIIGPDVHTTLLAKELIKHNFEITFITYGDGGAPVEYIDGIKIIKTYREDSSLNHILKAFAIWKAMKKANTPIYYHHGGAAGIVSLFCKVMKRKLVWHIAHDKYVNREQENFMLIDRFGSWLDIKLADIIVAQSEYQRTILKKKFGRISTIIKNHFQIIKQDRPEKEKPPVVLWVGTMAKMKQPELFPKLTQEIPEAMFKMVGGPSDDQGPYIHAKEMSKSIKNINFLGFVPSHEINGYFKQAVILVNTAKSEGFPYAFIQAWMNYTPVVSLNSDPDGIIFKNRMGFHSKTFDQLVKDVKILLKDEALREEMGINGRKYVEREHDIKNIIGIHINIFKKLLGESDG